jgi:ABC-2 type transport system permease protein
MGMTYFHSLWGAREVLRQLVARDVKLRYKASLLGFFWSFLRPLTIMFILTIVFSFLLRFEIAYEIPVRFAGEWTNGSFPIFLLVALIPWFFTIGSLNDSVGSLLNNASLIRKVSVPLEIFPLASVLANLVNFFFSLLVFLPVLFLVFRIEIRAGLLLLPVLIVIQLLLTLGIACIFAIGNVFFRDVGIILEFIGMIWFYLTPIFYPLSYVQGRFDSQVEWVTLAYLLNPMTVLVRGYRWALLQGAPIGHPELLIPFTSRQLMVGISALAAWTLLTLAAAMILFHRYRRRIPDEL